MHAPALYDVLDESFVHRLRAPGLGETSRHAQRALIFVEPVETNAHRHGHGIADHDGLAIAQKRQKIKKSGGIIGDRALKDLLVPQTCNAEDEGRIALGQD